MNTNLVTYANVEVMEYNMLRSYGIGNVIAEPTAREFRIDTILSQYDFANSDLEAECARFLINRAYDYLTRHAIVTGEFFNLKSIGL